MSKKLKKDRRLLIINFLKAPIRSKMEEKIMSNVDQQISKRHQTTDNQDIVSRLSVIEGAKTPGKTSTFKSCNHSWARLIWSGSSEEFALDHFPPVWVHFFYAGKKQLKRTRICHVNLRDDVLSVHLSDVSPENQWVMFLWYDRALWVVEIVQIQIIQFENEAWLRLKINVHYQSVDLTSDIWSDQVSEAAKECGL